MEYLEAALACAQAGTSCVRAAELEALSQSRNTALRTACADRSSTACQSALQDAKNAALDHANNSNEYQNWLKKNGTSLFGAINQPGNEKLLENIITHTSTADLTWKLDCAQAGSDCSRRGSMELLTQGELAAAVRHESMRKLLLSVGQTIGADGRAIESVTGLVDLLKEANTITHLGKVWSAVDYVNTFGLQAYLDAEQAKSQAMRTGLWNDIVGYLSDLGTAASNRLNGGPQWNIYDVLAQGNTEGKVTYDVLGLLIGASDLAAAAKAGTTARRAGKVVDKAKGEVIDAGAAKGIPLDIEWGKGIKAQGMPWEDYVYTQSPSDSRLPPKFKTFDFYDQATGTAISAKTLDTMTSAKLNNPRQVYSSLKGNIDAIVQFEKYDLLGFRLDASMISRRELRVAVPEGTTPAQWEQIKRAIEYGRSQGVDIIVSKVR